MQQPVEHLEPDEVGEVVSTRRIPDQLAELLDLAIVGPAPVETLREERRHRRVARAIADGSQKLETVAQSTCLGIQIAGPELELCQAQRHAAGRLKKPGVHVHLSCVEYETSSALDVPPHGVETREDLVSGRLFEETFST